MGRAQPELDSLPVVILSKATDFYVIRQAYELGANGYLAKPFAVEELYNYILRHSAPPQTELVERRQIIENLRRSEERVRFAQQAAHIGSWEWDIQADQLYWSDEMYKIFEKDPAEFKPDNTLFYESILPEDRPKAAQAVHEAQVERKPLEMEFRILTADDKVKWLHARGMITFSESGEPVRSAGTMQEITKRKQAEEELHAQNLLLTTIINSPPDDLIFALNCDYEYIGFNEKHRSEMKKVWNVDIQKGMNILTLMPNPELRTLARQSMDRALAGEAFVEIQHQPDHDFYYELSWNPIHTRDGDTSGVAVFTRNITKRVQTEKLLNNQIEELRRWYEVTLDREMRILELKKEVNDLLFAHGQPARYPVVQNLKVD